MPAPRRRGSTRAKRLCRNDREVAESVRYGKISAYARMCFAIKEERAKQVTHNDAKKDLVASRAAVVAAECCEGPALSDVARSSSDGRCRRRRRDDRCGYRERFCRAWDFRRVGRSQPGRTRQHGGKLSAAAAGARPRFRRSFQALRSKEWPAHLATGP